MNAENNNVESIIERLKNKDKRALTQLYNLYWQPLFISSYNILKNKEVCEEIIQDVFIDLWKNKESLEIHTSLNSYLYACVRYKVFGHLRKKKIVKVELVDDLKRRFQYATPETKLMHKELVNQIDSIVASLPKKCRKVYKLSRRKNLSHKEIADKLDISTKTVENHITIALKRIKIGLGYNLSMLAIMWLCENLY